MAGSKRRSLALAVLLIPASLAAAPASPGESGPKHGKCTIKGSPKKDVLRGTRKSDVICGRSGNDRIRGLGGDDLIIGGPGKDRVWGGQGDDQLKGGGGSDFLHGGSGDDLIYGGGSSDSLFGEPDDDILEGGGGEDSCDGGPGIDLCDGLYLDRRNCSRELQPDEHDFRNCAFFGPLLVGRGLSHDFVYAADGPVTVKLDASMIIVSNQTPWMPIPPTPTTVDFEFSSDVGQDKTAILDCVPQNGLWLCSGQIEVPAATPNQTLTLRTIVAHDDTGHTTRYTGDYLCPAGFGPCVAPTIDILGEKDEEPPVLESLQISPEKVDTATGAVDVRITAEASDDGAGIAGFESPLLGYQLDSPGSCSCAGGDYIEGTGGRRHTHFDTTLHLSHFSATGRYNLIVRLSDRAGNAVSLDPEELTAAGFPSGFEQVGTPGDETPPDVIGFDLAPRTVSAADGGEVLATVHVKDDLSGVRPSPKSPFGDSISILSITPEGHAGFYGKAVRVSGDDTDSVWQVPLHPDSGPPGKWRVELRVTDGAGNGLVMDSSDLEAAGFPGTFEAR